MTWTYYSKPGWLLVQTWSSFDVSVQQPEDS